MKKLSIVVPVYNAEKWLSETLDSLINQTYRNIEVICVDDGSVDSSCEIIDEYQKLFPQIKSVHKNNSGVSSARNVGISVALGDYIAFMDSDDTVEPDAYESMIKQIESDKSDISFCAFVRFWPNGKVQYTIEKNFAFLKTNPQDVKYFFYSTPSYAIEDKLYTNDIHGSSCRSIFRKQIIVEHNIRFHTDLKFAEDQIFVLEYLKHCNKISYSNSPYVHYRGWTKKRHYGNVFSNQMALIKYQKEIVKGNSFYNSKEKKKLIGYLECSTYFAIINDEFTLNPRCIEKMSQYSNETSFNRLLTCYSFHQKYAIRPEPKRIMLFVLCKARLWKIIKYFYPNKGF